MYNSNRQWYDITYYNNNFLSIMILNIFEILIPNAYDCT